jgi:hypothetical protein
MPDIIRNCQCEHESHHGSDKLTPNGNPGHRYGVRFWPEYLINVKTIYGDFQVCKDCAEDCYHPDRLRELGVDK